MPVREMPWASASTRRCSTTRCTTSTTSWRRCACIHRDARSRRPDLPRGGRAAAAGLRRGAPPDRGDGAARHARVAVRPGVPRRRARAGRLRAGHALRRAWTSCSRSAATRTRSPCFATRLRYPDLNTIVARSRPEARGRSRSARGSSSRGSWEERERERRCVRLAVTNDGPELVARRRAIPVPAGERDGRALPGDRAASGSSCRGRILPHAVRAGRSGRRSSWSCPASPSPRPTTSRSTSCARASAGSPSSARSRSSSSCPPDRRAHRRRRHAARRCRGPA